MLAIELQTTETYESDVKGPVVPHSVVNSVNFSGSVSVSGEISGTPGLAVSGNIHPGSSDLPSVTVTNTANSCFTLTTAHSLAGSFDRTSWATLGAFFGSNLVRFVRLSDALTNEIDRMLQEGRIDRKAFEILASEPELFYHAGSAYDALRREMSDQRLVGECRIGTFSDPESTRGPMLVLECRVKDVSCRKLIGIWKRLSLKLFEHAPKEVRKRIAFTMDTV